MVEHSPEILASEEMATTAMQQKYFFDLNLTSTERSHIGAFFTNEDQKQVSLDSTEHATYCQTQNHSAHGRVSATAKR